MRDLGGWPCGTERLALGLAAWVMLAGCLPRESVEEALDPDEDGVLGPWDCDSFDPQVTNIFTGRDLDGWMSAVAAQGLAGKNEVIDWLRRQGVFFNTASKLERIFANGGRPLYGEAAAGEAPPAVREARAFPAAETVPPRPSPPPRPEQRAPAAAAVDPAATPEIERLLAAARGYRPLATMMLREILRAVPDARVEAAGSHILLTRSRAFAALEPRPKDVRIALGLGERAFDAAITRTAVKGAPAELTHMLTLSDARRVNAELIALVLDSAAGA